MSELTGLIAISALGVASYVSMFYVTKMINAMGDQIVTGFIGDHPVPTTQRWLMLYSRWLSYVMGVVGASLGEAFMLVVIADHLGGADVRRLGYLLAFLLVIGAVNWVIQGIVQLISYRSLLRQAEAD